MAVDYPQFGTIESRSYIEVRIKEVAKQIRALSRQGESDVFDPFAFARDIGIKVQMAELPGTCSGRLRRDKGYALIEINSRDSRVRQRFTMCHETCSRLLLGIRPSH